MTDAKVFYSQGYSKTLRSSLKQKDF